MSSEHSTHSRKRVCMKAAIIALLSLTACGSAFTSAEATHEDTEAGQESGASDPPPVQDAMTSQEAGMPMADSGGSPSTDSGMPMADSGVPTTDSGGGSPVDSSSPVDASACIQTCILTSAVWQACYSTCFNTCFYSDAGNTRKGCEDGCDNTCNPLCGCP